MITNTLKELDMLNTHLIDVQAKIDMLKEELDDTKSYSLNLRKARVIRDIVEELEALHPQLQGARETIAQAHDACEEDAQFCESSESEVQEAHPCESLEIAPKRACQTAYGEAWVNPQKRRKARIDSRKRRKFIYKVKKKTRFQKRVDCKSDINYSPKCVSDLLRQRYFREKIVKYLQYLCIATLAGTVFACGGAGNSPTTNGNINISSSTSGSGFTSSSFSSDDFTPLTPLTFTSPFVHFTDSNGNTFGITFPTDPFGKGSSYALDGLDSRQFTTPATMAQRSGKVTMNGAIQVLNVKGLSPSERLGAASTLTFNFAQINNPISGKATDFGVYSSVNFGSGACTISTCLISKVRDVSGILEIKGNERSSIFDITLNGTLIDNVESDSAAVTRTFNRVSIPGVLVTNSDNSSIIASADIESVPLSTSNGNDTVAIIGIWKQ